MKIITCPHCGHLLEKNPSQGVKKRLRCPKCRKRLAPDDPSSKFSSGQMAGSGAGSFQERGHISQEMIIHGGVAMDHAEDKESVKTFHVPDGTVEEQLDFEWKTKGAKKKAKKNIPVAPTMRKPSADGRAAKTIRRPDTVDRRKKRGKNPYPRYYTALFYGIPGLLLFILVLFTLLKTTGSQDLDKNWQSAEKISKQAEKHYQKTLELKKAKKKAEYKKQAKQALDKYSEAIAQGEKVWQAQMKYLLAKGMTKQEAEKHAMINFGKYRQTIDAWKKRQKQMKLLIK